jgi:hypothetical protein
MMELKEKEMLAKVYKLTNKQPVPNIRVILRFSAPITKTYSILMPKDMTVRKLKNFIYYAFKEDVKNNTLSIFSGANQLKDDSMLVEEYFPKSDLNSSNTQPQNHLKEDVKQLIVLLKPPMENQNFKFNATTPKTEIFNSQEFDLVEDIYFTNFKETLPQHDLTSSKHPLLNKLPIIHYGFTNRLTQLNEKNKLNLYHPYDAGSLENFPLRNYLKIELILKLFLFYILFGIHVKGWNVPIFVSLLVVYYWYNIYTDLNLYYEKKVNEIKLTKEELKELAFLDKEDEDQIIVDEINQGRRADDSREVEVEENSERDEDNRNIAREVQDKIEKANDDIVVEREVDGSGEKANPDSDVKEITNKTTPNNKKKFGNDLEGIDHLLPPQTQRKQIKKVKQRENPIMHKINLIFEMIYVFVFSLFPAWCDEFELRNPFPVSKNSENDGGDVGNINNEREHLAGGGFNPEEEEKENLIHNDHNDDEEIRGDVEIEMKNLKERIQGSEFHTSEKERLVIKSSNDTRLVNHSENPQAENNFTSKKFTLVEEFENKTENEFVFSENVNIDTLSYNEPVVESFQKKHEEVDKLD